MSCINFVIEFCEVEMKRELLINCKSIVLLFFMIFGIFSKFDGNFVEEIFILFLFFC